MGLPDVPRYRVAPGPRRPDRGGGRPDLHRDAGRVCEAARPPGRPRLSGGVVGPGGCRRRFRSGGDHLRRWEHRSSPSRGSGIGRPRDDRDFLRYHRLDREAGLCVVERVAGHEGGRDEHPVPLPLPPAAGFGRSIAGAGRVGRIKERARRGPRPRHRYLRAARRQPAPRRLAGPLCRGRLSMGRDVAMGDQCADAGDTGDQALHRSRRRVGGVVRAGVAG